MIRRIGIVVSIAALAVVMAGVARSAGGPGGTMAQAKAAGWDCSPEFLIGGYFHCAPPGKPSIADLIEGTDVSSMVLRVFTPDGTFAGTEVLLRADLYAEQGCPPDALALWDELPFGYFACHHFNT